MKKLIAWLLALAVIASVSIGATLAFMTSTDEDINVMSLGRVIIEQTEYERVDAETEGDDADIRVFHDNKPLFPGVYDNAFDFGTDDSKVNWDQIGKDGYSSGIWNPTEINNEQDKMVFVKNKGDYSAYVRTIFAFEATPDWSFKDFQRLIHLNKNEKDWTWKWVPTSVKIGSGTYFIAVATYNNVLEPNATSEISLSQVMMDKLATNDDIAALGDTYQIMVLSQGIQSDGFTDPELALNEGFGTINAEKVPFDDDKGYLGSEMHTALRYANADSINDITTLVKHVVYGTLKDYNNIVIQHDGVLVDAEQDVDTFAYYVKDDNGYYTVYFLSDEPIHTPVNSTDLFAGMTSLETVDTSNLDVSRTTIMDGMFRNCEKLQSVDVSKWDTSNVKSTNDMFYCCISVNNLDVSKWDVSNVTSMSGMFDLFGTDQRNTALTHLDVSNWDVSNVTDMSRLFLGCTKLSGLVLKNWDVSNVTNMYRTLGNLYSQTYFDIENWDVSSCTTLEDTFVNAHSIKSLDLRKWDVSNVTNLQGTFTSLIICEYLDVTGWDTSNVTNMLQTFWNCRMLKEIEGVSAWNTSNVVNMRGIFAYCGSSSKDFTVDLSKWDTGSAQRMDYMFYMGEFQNIIGLENFDTSNVTNMYCMFYDCERMTEMNLSSWDTSKVTNMYRMFYYCVNLEKIYVSDSWTVENTSNTSHMFYNCRKLVGGAGTVYSGSYITGAYAHIDSTENPGYLTHINDKVAP